MRKLVLSLIFLLFAVVQIYAQTVNDKAWDADLEENILVGLCDRDGLQEGEFGEIFDEEYNDYQLDKEVIDELRKTLHTLNNYQIVVVFGTWCGDSQREVPRFFKVLDEAGIKEDQVKIYAVNRRKEGVTVDLSKYHIEFVPTFIVLVDGKEKGRIVESPEDSLEKDLLSIVKF